MVSRTHVMEDFMVNTESLGKDVAQIWKLHTLLQPYFTRENWHPGTFLFKPLPISTQHDFSVLGYDADNVPSLFIWWTIFNPYKALIEQYFEEIRTVRERLPQSYDRVEHVYGCLISRNWPQELLHETWPFIRKITPFDIDINLYEHILASHTSTTRS